ncbi:type 1 glutamine amidotransferase [Shewanella frigidimarina]|uniref:type 1 glutamine amidotransferase n=1 Tax=Shewanella frigidimarina TaxID=56812 RepID=UPI003D799243
MLNEFGLTENNDVRIWNMHNYESPASVDQCDVYIISGSAASVYDDDKWILDLKTFVQQAFVSDKKLQGICFGHQLINSAFGGTVAKSVNGWGLGVYSTYFHKIFMELCQGQKLSLFSMHQDQVIKLAKDFAVIAGNDFCLNYITRYREQVFTVQGHPEFSAQFFLAFLQEIKEKFSDLAINTAITSSTNTVDSKEFNLLIGQFINGERRSI